MYSPWNSPGQNTGVGSCSLLQGIFPTQGLNPGLLHWGQIWRIREVQEHWSGQSIPSSVDLPNPGIKPESPALQMDSLPAEPQGKPKNTGMGSLSLLQQIFPTQESNQSLLHCRQILYQLSYERSPTHLKNYLNSHFSNRISGLYSLTKCHYVMLCYAKSLQ